MAELRAMVAELREQKKKLLELRAMMAELVEQQKKESFLTKMRRHYEILMEPRRDTGEEEPDQIHNTRDGWPSLFAPREMPIYMVYPPPRDIGEEEPDQSGLPVRPDSISPLSLEFLASEWPRRLYWNFEEYVNANRESGLPIFSRPDLRDTSPGFMRYLRNSVLNIPPTYNWGLLLLSGSYFTSQMKNTTAPYQYFQLLEKTTEAPPQPMMLTWGESYDAFFPEMTDMTKFILCYILCLTLICPLHPGVQIVCLLLWVLIPFTYFPDLFRNSSRADVTCGSFKLAPIWFTSLGAVGISIICLAATMLIFYMRFRLSNGNPRVVVKDVDGSLNGLAEVLEG